MAKITDVLGINHAGFDVAEVDGHYFLLEFNPKFGTQALNDRGIRLGKMVFDYLSALNRSPLKPDRGKSVIA